MSSIFRIYFIAICCTLPGISYSNHPVSNSETSHFYSQLQGKYFHPAFGSHYNGLVIKPEKLAPIIEFQFFEDSILYTINCYTTNLQINSIKVYHNSHKNDLIASAIKIKIEKNKDLKLGFREIYIYLLVDGSIHHIEFGSAKLYENNEI